MCRLRALVSQAAPRMAQLAKHMGVSKPSTHHMLGRLEAKGVVRRDEEKRIGFTDAGTRFAEEIREKRCDIEWTLALSMAISMRLRRYIGRFSPVRSDANCICRIAG